MAAARSYEELKEELQDESSIGHGPSKECQPPLHEIRVLAESPAAAPPDLQHSSSRFQSAAHFSNSLLKEEFTLDLSRFYTKAFGSNCATFALMLVGVLFKYAGITIGTRWLLAAGVFGFAGGFTNWLAVHMLFERVPLLYGSGVIPMRFVEIREAVKDTMMRTFFDTEYLGRYLRDKLTALSEGEDGAALQAELARLFASPAIEALVDSQLEALKAKPEGLILAMQARSRRAKPLQQLLKEPRASARAELSAASSLPTMCTEGWDLACGGIEPRTLKPIVMAFVKGAATDLGPILANQLDLAAILPVDRLRHEIDSLMSAKLLELTPERVKTLLEEVIRVHLGWLVVWGNVFGALIGVLSCGLGYA